MASAGFSLGDERGFIAHISSQTGTVESVRDERHSMAIREFSDLKFVTSSQPRTLRYRPADLGVGLGLLGRHDLQELSAATASKTIEVAQGRSLGGVIRIKYSNVSSAFRYGIECPAEPAAIGRWLLESDAASPFTVDCITSYADTGESIPEICNKPLTFLIDRPSHAIFIIQAKRLLEDTCVLTDNWQMAAVLSSLFHDPRRYLPVLPVMSVPPFFAKRQFTSLP